mmetsp:Transcript_53176/g.116679  ORF Transcript_53176/g.116679 Transcript_53176/m.116679 type:complete len:207 (-) Transcript_53176:189-809(-)
MTSVYLYIPNLIGYARVALAFIAFSVAFRSWELFLVCYISSQVLDAFDGWAARKFDQCSSLGALLDMVTDRFSTAVLYMFLCQLYPDYYMVFVCLSVLDFVSHWSQMSASQLLGLKSHKDAGGHFLMRLYYTNRPFLFACCGCQELFLLGLYVAGMAPKDSAAQSVALYAGVICTPLNIFKQGMNFLQLKQACDSLVEYDLKQKAK